MNSIEKALDCLKNGNRTWEAMGFLQESIKADELTQEVLRQLREEREALTLRVEEQRMLLEQSLRWHQGDKWREGNSEERAAWEAHHDAITQHLKGKE